MPFFTRKKSCDAVFHPFVPVAEGFSGWLFAPLLDPRWRHRTHLRPNPDDPVVDLA